MRLLKKARYLRKVRGLNAAAIVQMLKREGLCSRPTNGASNAIGPRLRRLRTRRGLSLAQVAKAAGISVGFLSALERSQMSASVGTLRKLARYYRTNILDFFDPTESNTRLVSSGKRKVLEAGPGVRMELLAWGNTVMEPHLFRIAPKAGSGESYSHEGEEFLYVLRGELKISLEGEEYHLKPGDSFYFESATPHQLEKSGPQRNLGAVGQHAADILAGASICRTGTSEKMLVESGKPRGDGIVSAGCLLRSSTLLAGAWAKPSPPMADTVIVNARIYTVNPAAAMGGGTRDSGRQDSRRRQRERD